MQLIPSTNLLPLFLFLPLLVRKLKQVGCLQSELWSPDGHVRGGTSTSTCSVTIQSQETWEKSAWLTLKCSGKDRQHILVSSVTSWPACRHFMLLLESVLCCPSSKCTDYLHFMLAFCCVQCTSVQEYFSASKQLIIILKLFPTVSHF